MTCFPENNSLAFTLFSRGRGAAGVGGEVLPWVEDPRKNHGVGLSEKAFGHPRGRRTENPSDGPYYHVRDDSRLADCYATAQARISRLFGNGSLDKRVPRPRLACPQTFQLCGGCTAPPAEATRLPPHGKRGCRGEGVRAWNADPPFSCRKWKLSLRRRRGSASRKAERSLRATRGKG